MLGAAGAMLCLGAGTAAGLCMRSVRARRLELLLAEADMLCGLKLMLQEERLGLCELFERCAALLPECDASAPFRLRLLAVSTALRKQPLIGVGGAYTRAAAEHPIAWEGAPEREVLSALFARLGTGTAAMREQAASSCLRRLKPIIERARERSETGGKLCVRLCMLMGLMLGVALW